MSALKVLMLSSECVPFVKTGGIADVVGSLPLALKQLGVDVRVVLPRYSVIPVEKFDLRTVVPAFEVPLDSHREQASVLQGTLGADVPVYFIENPRLYQRDGIYMYPDDAERFIFFCRAALEMCRKLDWQPDIIHSHDWQTAIVPNWLKTIYADDTFFRATASVYTIHNLAYQGLFGERVLEIAGLAAYGFVAHPDLTPDINQTVDFMARGILFGDALTTVSERYANEILTPDYGEKLDPILRARKDRLFGILNGIDYERFDPASDPHVPSHYDATHRETRAANKAVLQQEAGLSVSPDVPLIGILSRLNDQKGIYLLRDTIEHVLQQVNVQFVLMGTGDADLQAFFGGLAKKYAGRAAYLPTFNTPLAAKLFSGSDIYLMPSRFEPAGTNQMLALRYGAVPVVRATGGLADTVRDFDPSSGAGNGFTFVERDAWALYAAIVRAVETYRYREAWSKLQQNGMQQDLSWTQSARRYVEVYQFAIEKRIAAAKKQQALADDIAHTAQVIANLPARVGRLGELAYNLWWTWNPDAQDLFGAIDPSRWEMVLHNPIRLLREVSVARVAEAAANEGFVQLYNKVMAEFDEYMGAQSCWFGATYPYATDDPIAYLSFEFGLHESLPIYSGGLGILAGDTCKEASDLGLPFVAVGFLYPQGFFRQQIDADGNQIALEEKVNFAEVPAVALRDAAGRHLLIGLELPGRTIHAQLWRIQVGRIALIMMDTDIEHNSPTDRKLLAQLYQGDQEVRIAQEMVFGIGSVRALREAGIQPRIWHLNEGHGAFLALELLRQEVQAGASFADAVAKVRAQTLFTTHTPVPAGNDAFPPELMDRYFGHFFPQLKVSRDEFLNLGMYEGRFSMTVLALRLSGAANGVSKLHGEVSRQMWGWLWPNTPVEQTPIQSITNGIHTASWLTPDLHRAFDQALGAGWYERLDEADHMGRIGEPARRGVVGHSYRTPPRADRFGAATVTCARGAAGQGRGRADARLYSTRTF